SSTGRFLVRVTMITRPLGGGGGKPWLEGKKVFMLDMNFPCMGSRVTGTGAARRHPDKRNHGEWPVVVVIVVWDWPYPTRVSSDQPASRIVAAGDISRRRTLATCHPACGNVQRGRR